jgi:hypothetical protein
MWPYSRHAPLEIWQSSGLLLAYFWSSLVENVYQGYSRTSLGYHGTKPFPLGFGRVDLIFSHKRKASATRAAPVDKSVRPSQTASPSYQSLGARVTIISHAFLYLVFTFIDN